MMKNQELIKWLKKKQDEQTYWQLRNIKGKKLMMGQKR